MKLTCHLCGKDVPFPAPVEVDTMNFDGLSDIEKAVYAHINLPKACPAHEPICVACGKQFQTPYQSWRRLAIHCAKYAHLSPCEHAIAAALDGELDREVR